MDGTADAAACGILRETLKDLTIECVEAGESKDGLRLQGTGCTAETIPLDLKGLRCDGYKILQEGADEGAVQRFSDGCLKVSQLRHANIMQLLGVYFTPGAPVPTVVMEHFPNTRSLDEALGKYRGFPWHAKLSVLLDVARALQYLHEQTPPVVHGLLSAKSVLLTSNSLQAKVYVHVTGVGVKGDQISEYTPPEAIGETPSNDAKGDIFSFGNLLIHTSIRRLPTPLENKEDPNPENPGETINRSEVERREKYLAEMKDDNPLQDLARKCLQDDPSLRPTAAEIVQQLQKLSAAKTPPYTDILEMYQALDQLSLTKETVLSLNSTVEAKQEEILAQQQLNQALKEQIQANEQELSAKDEELQIQKLVMKTKLGTIQAHERTIRTKDALIKAKDTETAAKNREIASKSTLLKTTQRRIEVLEHQLSGKYTGSPTASPSHSKPLTELSAEAEDIVMKRKVRGRRNKTLVMSDGFAYQNWQKKSQSSSGASGDGAGRKVDPRLATLLARQQHRIEENQTSEAIQDLESMRKPEANDQVFAASSDKGGSLKRQRSLSGAEPLPELQKKLERRLSQIEVSEDGVH